MKFLLVVAAFVGLASASNLRFGFQEKNSNRDLTSDLQGLLALFPIDDYLAIGRDYLTRDDAVRRAVGYMQGDDWASFVATVQNDETWQGFKAWGTAQGVDVDGFIGRVHDLIHSWDVPAQDGSYGGGLRAFVDDIRLITNRDEIMSYINSKLMESEDFLALYMKLSSPESRAFLNRLRETSQAQDVSAFLTLEGIDVQSIIDFIKEFFGWTRMVEYL